MQDYRRYTRSDRAWPEGLRLAGEFIAGALHHHVTTWTRHGRLGVPDGLNGQELCALLPGVVEARGEFGLLVDDTTLLLLVLPGRGPAGPAALCYGAWPGIDIWEDVIEPALPPVRALLSCTRWNEMPFLGGVFAASPTDFHHHFALPRLR